MSAVQPGQQSGFVLPLLEGDEGSEFWQGCARGELLVQVCGSCGRRRMPPRPMCPYCRSTERRWERTSGHATVWSFVVAHPPLLPAYGKLAPYNVVVVALDEEPGIRFVGNLVPGEDGGIDEVDPAAIEIGMPVRVVFQPVDDVTFPRWTPA
ncbi:MAG TPA: OB-fold domain-containing protein [Acidimicrobiia bacterium]|nr:OB-fold domain-containing protein [Acidimicrobiia bacterium]